ncbi:Nitrate/nitrite sensor protein [Polaromonas sp. CG9_12]|nr:Nitrate/nitrite sensor protein [Polaromonas sp. CG9_12]
MQHTASLSKKLIRIGASLLVVALASIGLTLWVTWQLEGGAAAVNEAGRMRMQTWRLTSAVHAGATPPELQRLVENFEHSLSVLRNGDASRPLFVPWDQKVRTQFATVESLWQVQRRQWLAEPALPVNASLQAAGNFVEAIDRFVLAIEQHLSRLTAILNLFQFAMMALAIAGAVVMLYTGYLYVISPLSRLRQSLEKVQLGEFATRIEVDTEDEFGQVAAGFNRMAGTLDAMYKGLESQVDAKTRHIEAQRLRLEALYEVSAFLAQAGSIEELARGFAQRVRTLMKADAGAVRWSDDASQRYLMLASDCFPQDMLEEERSLLAGACACGNLQPESRTRVIQRQGIAPHQLTVHSDNGSPMKGETMLATMQRLGVAASRRRPAVSNDNPYSEALFRTLKYRPQLPVKPFNSLLQARRWVTELVHPTSTVKRVSH